MALIYFIDLMIFRLQHYRLKAVRCIPMHQQNKYVASALSPELHLFHLAWLENFRILHLVENA
jgi:hypothetical protein